MSTSSIAGLALRDAIVRLCEAAKPRDTKPSRHTRRRAGDARHPRRPRVFCGAVRPRFLLHFPWAGGGGLMRKCTRFLGVYATTSLVLLAPALPARAIDLVPFVGLRFGGDLGTQPGNGVTGPTSVTIDSSVAYGGVIDIPYSQPRSVELYYSHQPTKLSGSSTAGDVTVNVVHIGLVDTLPSADQQLSWLLI